MKRKMTDSPGVFKAPLPIGRRLVTSREVTKNNKKLRSLTQLLEQKNLPDLAPYSAFLLNTMRGFGDLINVAYNQRRRNVVNGGLKCQEILEDVVIRRLMRGEDVNVVLEQWKQFYPIEVGAMIFFIRDQGHVAG